MSSGISPIWRNEFRSLASCRPFLPPTRGLRLITSAPSVSTSPISNDQVAQKIVPDPTVVRRESDEATAGSRASDDAAQRRKERNAFMRKAFRETSPATQEQVQLKHRSPYVPAAREYPCVEAASSSRWTSNQVARVQVGVDKVWNHFDQRVPDWTETFHLLKRMTRKRAESNMAAVRVVLPPTVETTAVNKRVRFLDPTTGLTTKLRATRDRKNPSTLVLRGERSALAKAADELVRTFPDVEMFQLGDVTTFDYMAKRLWPSIDNAADGASSRPKGERGGIWLHKEDQTHWIDRPYEETPRPTTWTKASFETYIRALVCGKLRSHLAVKYYRRQKRDGNLVDTDGIRVRLIMDAFKDPLARDCITPSVLKLALAFMAHRGGHRASAERLFALAEKWSLPMDTEVFNIILDGYVSKRDPAFFHRFLLKMESRCFYANARTWLHFLNLVQRDDARRQVISAMHGPGLLGDAGTRRGIAEIMAGHDAYTAFRAGKTLNQFTAEQATRYGQDWFTSGAKTQILRELVRFDGRLTTKSESFLGFMRRPVEDGLLRFDMRTAHAMLQGCLENRDWTTALWTLKHMRAHACEPDPHTYTLLTSLAIVTGARATLGILVFYGLLTRSLRPPARRPLQAVLLRRLLPRRPVRIFSSHMAGLLERTRVSDAAMALAGVEWVILRSLDGYEPVPSLATSLAIAWRTIDLPSMGRAALESAMREDRPRALASFAPNSYAVKLRDGRGSRPPVTIHLDAAFEPETMIRKPQHGTPAGRHAA